MTGVKGRALSGQFDSLVIEFKLGGVADTVARLVGRASD